LSRLKPRDFLKAAIFFILLFMAWGTIHVWSRTMAVEQGYCLSHQQALKEQFVTDNNALQLEISTLKSSKRLESMANDMGLHTPCPDQVIYIWQDE